LCTPTGTRVVCMYRGSRTFVYDARALVSTLIRSGQLIKVIEYGALYN